MKAIAVGGPANGRLYEIHRSHIGLGSRFHIPTFHPRRVFDDFFRLNPDDPLTTVTVLDYEWKQLRIVFPFGELCVLGLVYVDEKDPHLAARLTLGFMFAELIGNKSEIFVT